MMQTSSRTFSALPPASLVGKQLRLERIFDPADSRSVIFAMDHGVERGPAVFPPDALNPREIVARVIEAGVDALMLTKGAARATHDLWRNRAALVLKISGKSELRTKEAQALQSPIGDVEEAAALGADAVAQTVYWGSKYEDVMMERFLSTSRRCESLGMPLLQLAYPRVEGRTNSEVEIVSYAARLAFETGADAIKTYYTGDTKSFSQVVASAGGVPVLLSGGQASDDPLQFLGEVASVMAAGAKGVVVGRNVFQNRDPAAMARAVIKIVHDEWSPEKAEKSLLAPTGSA